MCGDALGAGDGRHTHAATAADRNCCNTMPAVTVQTLSGHMVALIRLAVWNVKAGAGWPKGSLRSSCMHAQRAPLFRTASMVQCG